MTANIDKIPHIRSFKPPKSLIYTTDVPPKSNIKYISSFDPFKDIIQSQASYLSSNKKLTIYVDEDSTEEDNHKNKTRNQKEHIITITNADSESEFVGENKDKDPDIVKKNLVFPSEVWKTVLAAIILVFTFLLNLIALSIIHDKVPRSTGPLPDVILDLIPTFNIALNISEYVILFLIFSSVTSLVLFHKYSSIVFRRVFLMLSILYLYRTITMSITILPAASYSQLCAPKLNNPNINDIFKRFFYLITNFGLSLIEPQVFCGDLIYSGHTVLLILIALIISEYTSKSLNFIKWIYWAFALLGILMLELSHGHYLVDVVIAYYVTTRVFWTYQTLANNENLKTFDTNNCFNRAWWFKIFLFFEKNIHGPVPNECQWLFGSESKRDN